MVLHLPNEILTRIIECAAFQDKIDDLHYTYLHRVLINLCLVSKRLYTLAAPLLYRDIIIRTAFPVDKLLPKITPLLSKEQRRNLRDRTSEGHDVFIDQERMVNPLWVRKLVLLEAGYANDPRKQLLWWCIQDAVQGMENLQFVCWESKPRSPRLAENLRKLPRLSQVVCRGMDYLCSPGSQLPPLGSLSIIHLSPGPHALSDSLHEILEVSPKSLRELHFFRNPLAGTSVPSKDNLPTCLPAVEDLLLTGYDDRAIEVLTKVIDFSRLKFLQLVRVAEKGHLPRALGQQALGSLRKLSVCLVPSSVVDILNRCENIQEIHVVWEDEDPQKMNNPTSDIVGAVLRHGSTLTALTLNGTFRCYAPISTEEFARLVNGCPILEDLRVNIDFLEWGRIAAEIPKLLCLKHLCLDRIIAQSNPTPFTIEGPHVLTCHGEPWWNENDYDRGPRSHFSEVEKAMGRLLEASVNHAVLLHSKGPTHGRAFCWRDYSKLRSVKISSQGLDPRNHGEFLTQAYLLREGEPMAEFQKPYSGSHRGTRWLAPVGHLYSYNALGISISLQIAQSHPKYARLSYDEPPAAVFGKWDTAFKAPSEKAEGMLQQIIRMH